MEHLENQICWYTRRHELCEGQVFRTEDGPVRLGGRVAGDGTKWWVLDWLKGWSDFGSTVEPGDLIGEPLTESEIASLS